MFIIFKNYVFILYKIYKKSGQFLHYTVFFLFNVAEFLFIIRNIMKLATGCDSNHISAFSNVQILHCALVVYSDNTDIVAIYIIMYFAMVEKLTY